MVRPIPFLPFRASAPLLLLAGCVSYQPLPLDPRALLADLRAGAGAEPLPPRLPLLIETMRGRNPAVLAARASLQRAKALHEAGVPLPDPTIGAGPLFFDGSGILSSARWGVVAALGWALPLSGARGVVGDLDAARHDAARTAAGAVLRTEYLALRREVVDTVFAAERARLLRDQADRSGRFEVFVRRLHEAGRTSAAQWLLAATEVQRALLEVVQSNRQQSLAQDRVAARCGWPPGGIAASGRGELPPLPAEVPSLESLQEIALTAPQLEELAALHAVAEHLLRLEIRRQYPDLDLSLGYEREQGIDRFSLPLGIAVPLFDGNRRGIAEAQARRAGTHRAFEQALQGRMGAIAAARTRLDELRTGSGERIRALESARSRLAEVAERSARAGILIGTEYLLLASGSAAAEQALLAAEQSLHAAWLDLEQACGAPLLLFPGEEEAR